MNLDAVSSVVRRLRSHAVIGAYALAARGYVRQTTDFDLMTADTMALEAATWNDFRERGYDVDVRRGDPDDPLAGVVRLHVDDASIDVIVARYQWQQQVIDRAETMSILNHEFRIPRTSDLILLKLFAGGYGDLHDVSRLLNIGPRDPLVLEVTASLRELPAEMQDRWQRLLRAEQ